MIYLIIFTCSLWANEKVEYKYKDYEKIDLGDFSVQGDVVTPGDLSLKDRKIKFINHDLYRRTDLKDLQQVDNEIYFKE